jgi:hypothetical protein
MQRPLFNFWACFAALAALTVFANCTPLKSSRNNTSDGKFEVSNASIYEQNGEFSLLDEVVYPERKEKAFDSRINVPNKYLTLGDSTHASRCTRCHECGFEEAWDMDHYQTPQWNPRYRGDEWRDVVQRMRRMDNSLINEKIADRIFSFLRDETLGTYDPLKDTGPETVIEVNPDESRSVQGMHPMSPQ